MAKKGAGKLLENASRGKQRGKLGTSRPVQTTHRRLQETSPRNMRTRHLNPPLFPNPNKPRKSSQITQQNRTHTRLVSEATRKCNQNGAPPCKMRLGKPKDKCPGCGKELPKDLPLSGWPNHPYGLHTHCPKLRKSHRTIHQAKTKERRLVGDVSTFCRMREVIFRHNVCHVAIVLD